MKNIYSLFLTLILFTIMSLVLVINYSNYLFEQEKPAVRAGEFNIATYPLSHESKSEYWDSFSITPYDKEKLGDPIVSFDVNEQGQVAIALSSRHINVYNNNGDFIYGFSFKSNGAFYVAWNKSNLIIITFRSHIITEINNSGELIDMGGFGGAAGPMMGDYIDAIKRYSNGNVYTLKKVIPFAIIPSSFPILELNRKDGTSEVIYDSSLDYHIRLIIYVLFFLIIVFFFILAAEKSFPMIPIFERQTANTEAK